MKIGDRVRSAFDPAEDVGTVIDIKHEADGEVNVRIECDPVVIDPPKYGRDGVCIDAGRTYAASYWRFREELEIVAAHPSETN